MTSSPEEIEREVEAIRNEMTPVLNELDHRRHDLTDWRRQLRQRGPAIMKVVGIVGAIFTVVKLVRRVRASRRDRRSEAMATVW